MSEGNILRIINNELTFASVINYYYKIYLIDEFIFFKFYEYDNANFLLSRVMFMVTIS